MTYTCTGCGEKKTEVIHATGHKFGDYEVTKEATCTEDGVKTAKCTHDGCKETKTETIPATGHDYETKTETKTVVDKEAWDEVKNTTIWYCTGCKAEFNSVEGIDAHLKELDNAWDRGETPNHPVKASSSTKTITETVHHEAETHEETITKHVCKKCGHVKED